MHEALKRAEERCLSAGNILQNTYPALGSPKLLLNAMEHLFLSMDYTMNTLLESEGRKLKPTFLGRFHEFRIAFKGKVTEEEITAIKEMRDTLLKHRQSPVVFVRGDALVICDAKYNMTLLTAESLAKSLALCKSFLNRANEVLQEQPLSNSPNYPTQ